MPQPITGAMRTGTPQEAHHRCSRCDAPILAFQWVDGILRDLRRRRHCTDCIPLLPGGRGMTVEDFDRARSLRMSGHSLQFIADELGKHRTWIGYVVADVPRMGDAADHEPPRPKRKEGTRKQAYAEASQRAIDEWPEVSTDPLVMMCIGFYISEGDKLKPGNTIRVANCDPEFQRKMVWFFEKLGVPKERIRASIALPNPPPIPADEAMRYWSEQIGVPLDRFNRTHIQKMARSRPIRYPHGVCYVTGCDVLAKKRLETWMDLALRLPT